MHFITHYDDDIIIGKPLGGPETGWNNLPEKPIRKLEYVNPYGDNIILEGYDEYNHFVEVVQRMGGKPYLVKICLMGADNGNVMVHEIMLDESHLGQVVTKECERGTEYNGEPSWGWKAGIANAD